MNSSEDVAPLETVNASSYWLDCVAAGFIEVSTVESGNEAISFLINVFPPVANPPLHPSAPSPPLTFPQVFLTVHSWSIFVLDEKVDARGEYYRLKIKQTVTDFPNR